jgi:hypothetical protein
MLFGCNPAIQSLVWTGGFATHAYAWCASQLRRHSTSMQQRISL